MMYKVTLPIYLDGPRYGIDFFRGVGVTEDERIAALMEGKGFKVEETEDNDLLTDLSAKKAREASALQIQLEEVNSELKAAQDKIAWWEKQSGGDAETTKELAERAESAETQLKAAQDKIAEMEKTIAILRDDGGDDDPSDADKPKKPGRPPKTGG